MGYTYVVEQGDCLWKIARREGFAHWRTIYDHPKNADYRALRPNPNILYPGDRLYIPDLDAKSHNGATGQRHTFQLEVDSAYLFLIVEDDDGNRVDGTYTLEIDGRYSTDELVNGEVKAKIPADAETGRLVVHGTGAGGAIKRSWSLELGCLDPVKELSGVQARLQNLGFDCGPVDNVPGPLTEAAVLAFQKTAFTDEREWDGIPGPKTQAKLVEHHRS